MASKAYYGVRKSQIAILLGNILKIEVLHPPESLREGTSDDVDNNGVVPRLSWDNVSFLFTANIRADAEFELIMQRANLKGTVLN